MDRIIVKPRDTAAEKKAAEAPHPEAKKILPHGLLFRYAVVCNKCAEGYNPGLVDDVSYNEVSDAFWRINDYLIGRIGPRSDRWEACYDCEAELL
jgi:hypothetical protein